MIHSSKFIKRAAAQAGKATQGLASTSLSAGPKVLSVPSSARAAVAGGRQFSSAVRPARGGSASASTFNGRRLLSTTARLFEEKVESGTLSSPSELARKLSEAVLPRIPRPDVKKVLVVGSGGLSIGQAGEFDYSGEHIFAIPPSRQQEGAAQNTMITYAYDRAPPRAMKRLYSLLVIDREG